ncbi:hypothetical protein GCM10023238_31130 [Streptomyces heliomycini]
MRVTHAPGKYADFESLREQAVALRRAGHSLRQIRDELKIYNNDILNQLVKGEPPPAWTKRPNAKDGLRAKARELRLQGWTYDRIQGRAGLLQELGVAVGTGPAETRTQAHSRRSRSHRPPGLGSEAAHSG